MRRQDIARTARFASKLLLSVTAAAFLAACSDSLERLTQSFPGSNPSDADPVYTATVPKTKSPRASQPSATVDAGDDIVSSPIESTDLSVVKPPRAASPNAKLTLKQNEISAPVLEDMQADAQPDIQDSAVDEATDEPVVIKKPATTASMRGAKVKVREGMTMYSIARANGVSVKSLAKANGIRPPYELMVGQVLRIPGAKTASVPQVADAAPIKRPTRPKASLHTVAAGDTLFSLGRKYGVSPFVIADANGLKKNSRLSLGQELRIPRGQAKWTAPKEDSRVPTVQNVKATPETDLDDASSKNDIVAIDAPAVKPVEEKVAVADPVQVAPKAAVEAPEAQAGALNMRWPARGKIISEFGKKPNGLKNEGINIALPEGAPIKAAESGVVAYAGNELKGYGNLVLIRHEGGYVTAYAHAKNLNVKRGDTVKRGDIIATAGQTGAVTSPQLHFEVRKGATALDPLKFIGNATASN